MADLERQEDFRGIENPTEEQNLARLISFSNRERPKLVADPEARHRYLFWKTMTESLDNAVERGRFTADEKRDYLAVLITSKELREETDPLMLTYNRSGLESRLDTEFERARRYNSPLTLAFMDVDHFKLFNDTYGHPMGDFVLREWSAFVKGRLRKTDILGRYGGEEVVAILPSTDEQAAVQVMNRIREDLPLELAEPFGKVGITHTITMSVGIAQVQENDSVYQQALTRADNRVYIAKELGRNRVVYWDRPQEAA